MKGIVAILTMLMLAMVLGTAWAAGDFADGLATRSANNLSLLPDELRGNTAATDEYTPASWVDGDDGIADETTLSVFDYDISEQATIDLECRLFITDDRDPDLIGDVLDVEQLAQNLMVRFSYKF
jgi:hypothetical protein